MKKQTTLFNRLCTEFHINLVLLFCYREENPSIILSGTSLGQIDFIKLNLNQHVQQKRVDSKITTEF